jgi:hypothetical protein
MPPELTRLEDLTKGALVTGVPDDRAVRVVDVAWHGSNDVSLTYTDEPTAKVDQELLYRDDETAERLAWRWVSKEMSLGVDEARRHSPPTHRPCRPRRTVKGAA